MAGCVKNIHTKNHENLIIFVQVFFETECSFDFCRLPENMNLAMQNFSFLFLLTECTVFFPI